MRISSYNPQNRYRQRSSERMAAFIFVLLVVGLSFLFGFWMGNQKAGSQERAYKKQVETLSNEREVMQESITNLRAQAQTANMRYEQLQNDYEEILPEGPVRELVALVKQQLDEGRSAERLKFLIRSARPPRNCSEPETKRFVVSTPAYDGPASKIALARGAFLISATGKSAMSADGLPEAWYDAAKTVQIKFAVQGEDAKLKSGVMPIRHSLVVNDREYRITVAEGARSFAKVTFDSCDYP